MLLALAAVFAILVGIPVSANGQLAPTPYMGWNTYYGVGGIYNESTIKSVASSLISSGLAQAGYKIVWLDWGWSNGARDASGNLIADPTQWPDGMAGLTAWLHAQKPPLQAGIYTDAGTSGCSNSGVGSYGHYQQDANQFAAWGFDAVKVDFCGAGQTWNFQTPFDPRTLYGQFSSALANNASGRPMILNVDDFWQPNAIAQGDPTQANSSYDSYQWAPPLAQSWRTDTDIGYGGGKGIPWWAVLRNLSHDTGTSSNASQPGIQNAAGPPGSSGISWGHWNDPDYLGPELSMTDAQAQSQFSMWAMVAAPLILGSDPRALSLTSIGMLTNANVIKIDQDSQGAQATVISSGTSSTGTLVWQVWVKPLAGGARAVALFNRSSSAVQISTSAHAVGLPHASSYELYNVWTNQTSTTTSKITALVQPYSVVLYRVSAG
jgi:alpha-galactosidase